MRYIFDFINHFFSSNSRHGTHSPFVYKLADELIYRKSDKLVSDVASSSDLLIDELQVYLKHQLGEEMVVLDIRTMTVDEVVEVYAVNSLVCVKNIYKTVDTKSKWDKLKANSCVIISIDLFYFGLLIYRIEQPKENFKLRFPWFKY